MIRRPTDKAGLAVRPIAVQLIGPEHLKRCPECRTVLPRARFSRNKSRPDGLQRICKSCKKAHDARSYAKHREERLAASVAWKQANRERHNAMARESRKRRRTGASPRSAGRRPLPTPVSAPVSVVDAAPLVPRVCLICGATEPDASFRRANGRNRDECAACEDARRADPVEVERIRKLARDRARRYAQRHPQQKQQRVLRRRARMKEAPINDFTAAEWEALKRLHANTCAYCGSEGALTRDHVKPLAKGGSNTLANIVPACLSCNSAKRDADDWTPNPPPPFNGPLCACGCGLPAPIADDVSIQGGAVKGRSRRYVAGHTIRPPGPVNTENGDGK